MRRLARRLFTLCSAASLLLCVAVCVLWVRSYWSADGLQWLHSAPRDAWLVAVKFDRGRIAFGRYSARTADPVTEPIAWKRLGSSVALPELRRSAVNAPCSGIELP